MISHTCFKKICIYEYQKREGEGWPGNIFTKPLNVIYMKCDKVIGDSCFIFKFLFLSIFLFNKHHIIRKIIYNVSKCSLKVLSSYDLGFMVCKLFCTSRQSHVVTSTLNSKSPELSSALDSVANSRKLEWEEIIEIARSSTFVLQMSLRKSQGIGNLPKIDGQCGATQD